ncbi:MAG TPA: hypothetical protein VMS93_03655 [Candidatus Saccharimonadales bacterium]|nr:hypothetical protein [Candidatus Saccharimonadales bacterium]
MDLLDRYLHAVRFWLPKAQQQDIIEELSGDLRAQIEEQEAGLGRSLTDGELAALLKERGEPMAVARRYLPDRYLIGPALFPLYWLALRIVGSCYLIPWALGWLAFVVFSPSYRAAHPGSHIFDTWQDAWVTPFIVFGVVTAVFAVLERSQAAARWQERWDPRKLPAVRDPRRIPRGNSVTGLVFGVVFALWWLALPVAPSLSGNGVRVALTPVWRNIYWLMLGLSAFEIAMNCVNLFRPYWTRLRLSLRALVNLPGGWLVWRTLQAGPWVEVSGRDTPAVHLARIAAALNGPAATVLKFGIAVFALSFVLHAIRVVRWRPPGGELPAAWAASGPPRA